MTYKFFIIASIPYSSDKVFIDAITGLLVGKQSLISSYNTTGSADTRYSGTKTITTDYTSNTYRLRELTNSVRLETYNMRNQDSLFSNAQDFTDQDNNWTTAEYHANLDDAALDAHWGLERVYAFWNSLRNRDSWDNNKAPLQNYIHVDLHSVDSTVFPNNDNAAWDYGREIMIYGDGANWFTPLVSVDIIGHETGHAYGYGTGHVPGIDNLVPNWNETLAINEGLADIWGACVEHYADQSKQNWQIGEEIMNNGFSCMRSLRSPTTEGFGAYDTINEGHYPDTYQGEYWYTDPYRFLAFSHINCTVLDHWFYLLSEGGEGIFGIGIDEAAKILWNAELNYFTPGTTYSLARDLTIQAAIDIFENNSCETMAVTNAWHAVGIGTAYSVPYMSVSGPPLVCTNGSYTLNNALKLSKSYSHITWSINPSYLVSPSSGGGGITANTSRVGNGNPIISFNPGCGLNNKSLQFHTGPYSSSDYPISGPSSAHCNSYVYYSIPQLPGVTSINWDWPQEWTYVSGQGTRYLALRTGLYGGIVAVGVNNTCGQSGSYATKYTYVYGYCGYGFSIYPNPASDNVTITMNENPPLVEYNDSSINNIITTDTKADEPTNYTIRIYNSQSILLSTWTRSGKSFNIPLINMRDGTYIIEVSDGKNSYRQQLFVKHN